MDIEERAAQWAQQYEQEHHVCAHCPETIDQLAEAYLAGARQAAKDYTAYFTGPGSGRTMPSARAIAEAREKWGSIVHGVTLDQWQAKMTKGTQGEDDDVHSRDDTNGR